jgi:hypothetical protein
MGKKHVRKTKVIFGARPYPIHKIKSGAMAITGIV